MIILKGEGRSRLLIGTISEPKLETHKTKSGEDFTICTCSITAGYDNINKRAIFVNLKAFGKLSTALAQFKRGDLLLVVAEEKIETWESINGAKSATLYNVKKAVQLNGESTNTATRGKRSRDLPIENLASLDDEELDDNMPF